MAKFRFYFTSADAGEVYGTNDEKYAKHLAEEDDNYVIDTTKNMLLQPNGDEDEIVEGIWEDPPEDPTDEDVQ